MEPHSAAVSCLWEVWSKVPVKHSEPKESGKTRIQATENRCKATSVFDATYQLTSRVPSDSHIQTSEIAQHLTSETTSWKSRPEHLSLSWRHQWINQGCKECHVLPAQMQEMFTAFSHMNAMNNSWWKTEKINEWQSRSTSDLLAVSFKETNLKWTKLYDVTSAWCQLQKWDVSCKQTWEPKRRS